MSELKVLPLLWKGDSEEANPEVHRLARNFWEEHLSGQADFKNFMRTWLLADVGGFNRNVILKAQGLMALRMVVDTPLFHMQPPGANREDVEAFLKGYKMLATRGREYLQDQGWGGQQMFVHVSEDSENATMVKHLTKMLGLKPSHRLAMEV